MNIEQLMECRDRVKKIMGNDEDLVDFVKVVDFILTKPYKHVCRGIKQVEFEKLNNTIDRLGSDELAKQEISGWSDTLDILTNPKEMEMIKKFN